MELTTPARRVLATRLEALAVGDQAMVRECEAQLARWGISFDDVESAVEVALPVDLEVRPRRVRTRTRSTPTQVKGKG